MKVNIEYQRQKGRGGALARVSLPGPMAEALAVAIRDRVQRRAQPTSTPVVDDTKTYRFIVSPRYPHEGGREGKTGGFLFESSAAYHVAQGAKVGAFSVTGGMWAGLTARHAGPSFAQVLFRGRSEGLDPNVRTYASGARKARGKKVSNALKAWSCFARSKVNVLEVTDGELRELEVAAVAVAARSVAAQMPATIVWDRPPQVSGLSRMVAERVSHGG